MPNRAAEQLDKLIQQLEVRLERLRSLRAFVVEDITFVSQLQELWLNPESNGVPDAERLTSAREVYNSPFVRVRDFLLSKNNEAQSLREIAQGTTLTRDSVKWVIYESHKPFFECVAVAGRGHMKLWRLTEEGMHFDEDAPAIPQERPKIPKPKIKKPIPKLTDLD